MIVLPRPTVKLASTRPITNALLPTDIGLFPSAARHYVDRRAGLSQVILIYCVRGGGWAEVDGSRCAVEEEQVLIVPPGRPHVYGAAEPRPWTIYWCHVAGHTVRPLLEALNVNPRGPTVVPADSRLLVPLFERLITTLQAGYARPALLTASLTLSHLFGELIACHGRAATPAGVEARLNATIDFMRQRVGGTVRLDELAALARLSPSHFAAMFKRKTGCSVLDYFTRQKVQTACALLDSTPHAIKEVAAQVGYDDPLYFSRVFRKVMGLSPAAFRATRKG